MPHLRPLNALRDQLQAALEPRQIFHAPIWGDPQAMTDMLRSIRLDFGGTKEGKPKDDVLQASLSEFARTHQVTSFTELKYVCHGVTVPVGDQKWRIIDSAPLFKKLFEEVAKYEVQPKQFRRCYQGLLSGYFGFERYADSTSSALPNWQLLRGYLSEKVESILRVSTQRGTTPEWLLTLHEHRNLLTDAPCCRNADGLSSGDTAPLREVCSGLGIEGSSWVWQDALMAYVRLVCRKGDAEFREGLTGILKVANGQADIKLPSALAVQATAMSVTRYAQCADRSEHSGLRDTCLHWIGNPWLKRTAWDAHVNHEPAREMLNSWLKRRLIRDFFELLAEDGSADLKRLNYWLKWEPNITDMWFVLGPDACANRSTAFVELRKRMAGRDRILTSSPSQNNAFVMRIGPLLVIEFGVTGNACYVFAASDFNTSLEKTYLSLHALKQRASATRLSHMSQWESRFDYEIKRLLQAIPMSMGNLQSDESHAETLSQRKPLNHPSITRQPSSQPTTKLPPRAATPISTNGAKTPVHRRILTESDILNLQIMCTQQGIEWEDNRAKKGALWVLLADRNKRLGFATMLDRYGFRYTVGKGFWLKDET